MAELNGTANDSAFLVDDGSSVDAPVHFKAVLTYKEVVESPEAESPEAAEQQQEAVAQTPAVQWRAAGEAAPAQSAPAVPSLAAIAAAHRESQERSPPVPTLAMAPAKRAKKTAPAAQPALADEEHAEDENAENEAATEGASEGEASPQPVRRWGELGEEERAAATTLGYAETAWNDELMPPGCALSAWDADPEASRSWDELSGELRAAAIVLGYTFDKWDEEMLPEGRPLDNHPETSMFQSGEMALAFDERNGANFECKVLSKRWKKAGGGGEAEQDGQWEYRVHYLGWKAKWDQWLTNEHVFKKVEHNIALLQENMGEKPMTKKEKKVLLEVSTEAVPTTT